MALNYRNRMIGARPMLTTAWSITNFKSVERAKVSLRAGQLTILTGTNSIGKSSLLQSILMLCQSMNNYGTELVLNGALARLGVPEDIVRDGCDSCQIGLDYGIATGRRNDERKIDVSCDISLRPTRSGQQNSELTGLDLAGLRIAFDNGEEFVLTSTGLNKADINTCSELFHHPRFDDQDLTILKATATGRARLTRTYVAFHGLQPMAVARLRTESVAYKAFCSDLKNYISSGLRTSGAGREETRYLMALRRELMPDEQGSARMPAQLAARRDMKKLSDKLEKLGQNELDELVDKVARGLATRSPHIVRGIDDRVVYFELDQDDENSSIDSMSLLVGALGGLAGAFADLSMRVGYIGPLRDDPRVISPLTEETGSNLPIGAKGERAAAVLLSKYAVEGRYGLPHDMKVHAMTLGDAVNAWAQYLGVADTVHASNKQKLGVSINVSAGSAERDLTQVGVGASQAIPILVGVLEASRGSVIIIEQPELHLHPSAQAKLADFLLFARPDVTILVETHSEALITRLRRRVVEKEANSKRINIQFFEKDGPDGGVVGRVLRIDGYGNLNEWPTGFMDAVQEDSRIIMKAAIAKRKEERGKNGR